VNAPPPPTPLTPPPAPPPQPAPTPAPTPPQQRPPPSTRPGIEFGTQGPWPVENRVYGGADGLQEAFVVGVTTDEAENLWVATNRALYLLQPGDKVFKRYDELDGLHLGAITGRTPGPIGWAKYCDMVPVADDAHCGGEVVWGGANEFGIRTLAGGAAGEVFVGYNGSHAPGIPPCPNGPSGNDWDLCDPARHSGKVDRVRLNDDGTISVVRFDFLSNDEGRHYWHNRIVNRLVYDHFVNHGTLYVGTEHGVNIVFPDRWTPPSGVFDRWIDTWFGDHVHARVCYHAVCNSINDEQRMGGWHGLAIDGDGQLWHAGFYTAGRVSWDPDPKHWWDRYGAAFTMAFGDPYPLSPNAEGWENEPVFKVAEEGDAVRMSGVAVCPDGKVWFSSWGPETGTTHTVAVFTGGHFDSWDATSLGLGENSVQDIVCMPDGRVVFAGPSTGLVVYDPARKSSKTIHAGQGIPSDQVFHLEVDRMTHPPSLHVATAGGAAVLRVLP
jgi:hypothetical protein